MDWTQALTVIGVFIGGFFFLMNRMDANQKENNAKFDHLGDRVGKVENRLTALEAETKSELRNINQRLSTIESYLMPNKVFRFRDPHKEDDEPKEN